MKALVLRHMYSKKCDYFLDLHRLKFSKIKQLEHWNMYFFAATGWAVEPDAVPLCLHLKVRGLALSPILLASSACVDSHVVRTEHLPGAPEVGGTPPALSKVSGTVGIAVVSLRGAGMLKTDGRESELAAAGGLCPSLLVV